MKLHEMPGISTIRDHTNDSTAARRLSVASVLFDWVSSELTFEIPMSKKHKPHRIIDQLQFRSPSPDGRAAMILLEVVDNRHQSWFDLCLQYRVCPIALDAHPIRIWDFAFRILKQPIVSRIAERADVLTPDDPCNLPLTPSRLGQFIELARTCTVELAGRPLHVHGLTRFGHWHRASKQCHAMASQVNEAIYQTTV